MDFDHHESPLSMDEVEYTDATSDEQQILAGPTRITAYLSQFVVRICSSILNSLLWRKKHGQRERLPRKPSRVSGFEF
jgi:hypothetical protein